ncbi:MAG TPA: NAD-binding protein [Burkholderiales bacterium]|nr:NAD-binding protein [Burkholderiales bacterium]
MKGAAFFLALRRLRAPIIYMATVFFAGIAGLVLIPGVDPKGEPWHFTMLQALYFMAYTATTIGFGEIPHPFTDTQRLWVTAAIFASVLGWAYLVASLLALGRDAAFRTAVVGGRFRFKVHNVSEPFYLICGFGETGRLVGQALDVMGKRFVMIDIDPLKVEELDLMELRQDPPAMAADARLPETLLAAGLRKRHCEGVLALTNDDRANLAVAMSVRLLHPEIPVVARAMSRETAANMASFGTDHIINPFAEFGEYLALAIASPGSYRLLSWLTGLPGTTLEPETAPPRGHWVVCGYGRFGREVVAAFRAHGLDVTIIDPQPFDVAELKIVQGRGTEAAPLRAAGIERSVGIVAGTEDDISNLSIAVTARELNPRLFTIVRQNAQANRALFEAFGADITMVSSEVIANECVALIRTPLLERFLAVVRRQPDAWADDVIARMQERLGNATPDLWSVTLSPAGAPAIAHGGLALGELLRDSQDRDQRIAAFPLYLARGANPIVLPPEDTVLQPGDQLLFAGTPDARRGQWPILRNVNVRDYVLTGVQPGGWLWEKLAGR